MNKKYKLKVSAGLVGSEWEDEMDWFTEDDFKRYEDGTLGTDEEEELAMYAMQLSGFEFWVEEDTDE